MTRDDRAALERIAEDARKARVALDLLEDGRESGVGTALLGAYLDQVRRGLAELLSQKEESHDRQC